MIYFYVDYIFDWILHLVSCSIHTYFCVVLNYYNCYLCIIYLFKGKIINIYILTCLFIWITRSLNTDRVCCLPGRSMTITCWKDHQVGVNCYSNYSWSPIGFFWFEEIYSTPNSQKPITLTRLQSFRSWIKTERSIKSILFSPIMLGC